MDFGKFTTQESLLDILNMIRDETGGMALRDIRPMETHIMCTCPSHKNGQERKPSCGVNIKTGVAHCFACGLVVSLPEFIGLCFGRDGNYGEEWLRQHVDLYETEERPEIKLNLTRGQKKKKRQNYVPEDVLKGYRKTHPYMYKRKLTDAVIKQFDVGYDSYMNCLTFPVRDMSGRTLFVARRSVDSKWFHYPEAVDKPLYGVYEWLRAGCPKEVAITESIINALTLWTHGIPAIALNGTGSYAQYPLLDSLGVRSYILCLDPDEAGRKGTEKIKSHVHGKLLYDVSYPDERDINDLATDEVNQLMLTKHLM